MPKMIKNVHFSGFKQASILAHFWPQTWLKMFILLILTRNLAGNFHFGPFLARNLARNVYFRQKIALSISFSSFITLSFNHFLQNPRATINFERFFSAKADFSESEKCRKWSKTTFFHVTKPPVHFRFFISPDSISFERLRLFSSKVT